MCRGVHGSPLLRRSDTELHRFCRRLTIVASLVIGRSLICFFSALFNVHICEDHVVIIILGKKPLVWQVVTVEMLDGRARRQQAVSGEQDFLLLLPMLMVMLMLILLLMRMIC